MYRPIPCEPNTPQAVRVLIEQVSSLFLMDVHAMLRLPCPEVGITQACNFAIASTLMNFISGVSVTLYSPPPNSGKSGRKFQGTLEGFYPWDTEPAGAITNPRKGAETLYDVFRNPGAHALGFQDPEPAGPIMVTRFSGNGLTEDNVELIETAIQRPRAILRNAPTLTKDGTTQAVALNVEALYWGVREMTRRLMGDVTRMARADALLRPMLRISQ